MAFKATVWSTGRVFLIGVALLATYLVFAAAAMRMAVRAREVVVPDVVGRSVNEASAALLEQGLTLKVEENERLHPDIPSGHVVEQEPPAGVTARQARSIRVWLSAGPEESRVPALVGESAQAAQVRAQSGALEMAVSEIRSSSYPRDAVVAQSPPPASEGRKVSVLINRGERGVTFVMPDLIGVSGDRASELLRASGFRVAVVADHPYPGVPPGIVLRQHPQAGFQIAPGEPVSLEVSR